MSRYALAVLILLLSAAGASAETDYSSETWQWGSFTVLMASAGVMELQDPWFNKPLIGGQSSRTYKAHDTVPYTWVAAGGAGVFGAIVLSPNEEGYFSSVTYANAKGCYGAFAVTLFTTAFSKDFFGRKRPSYDNYPPEEKARDGRKSFISGHSSVGFSAAAYGSLFIFGHVGSNDNALNTVLKTAASAALFSGACYTSWSRVNDHRHNLTDVAAGGAVGALTASIFYYIYNSGNKNPDRVAFLPLYSDGTGSMTVTFRL